MECERMSEKSDLEERNNILSVCRKLEELNLITTIHENKYSIQILVNCEGDFEKEYIKIRDRIRNNFKKQGYTVRIKGTYWLDIVFVDITTIIDDCFNGE